MAPDEKNPLNMYQSEPGGPFTLPRCLCSLRRREYFQRANRLLATYATLTMYAGQGEKAMNAAAASHQFPPETPIRITLGSHIYQASYRLFQKAFAKAGGQLTNQVFLLVYGNFEAFLIDIVVDAFQEQRVTDPHQEAFNLLAITRWPGKFDRITQKFSLNLGKRQFLNKYRNLDMTFLGKATGDPVDFLQAMADLRNRLGHSAGRADKRLICEYPASGLADGELIQLPFGLPTETHFFFVLMTDLLDEVFCRRFGWGREMVRPESLVDSDLQLGLEQTRE
jgi:hypothetical protein